jgi:hypothetical protein
MNHDGHEGTISEGLNVSLEEAIRTVEFVRGLPGYHTLDHLTRPELLAIAWKARSAMRLRECEQ